MAAPPVVRPLAAGDFPELDELQRLIQRAGPALRATTLCEVQDSGESLPVYGLELGAAGEGVPAIGFFGGVHGVERIGTQVVLAFLHTLVERLHWDDTLGDVLQKVRLVFMPLVNPGGMLRRTRANPCGVDLMRNAPVDGGRGVPWLLGGQRYTRALPWYRGVPGEPMQREARALCDFAAARLLNAPFSIALDCHSGFGTKNHVWFPYAHTRAPIDCLSDLYALRTMFRATHPNHSLYIIEPQSRRYLTHGDLWDWLYQRSRAERSPNLFLPLTLEMGSWLWIRKNPLQLFQRTGFFNPVEPHRIRRILRQHLTLFEFLVRATVSHARWRPQESQRAQLFDAAVAYWMDRPKSLTAVKDDL